MWVLGGAVSAVNALTPRSRPDPPDVGPELFSEVFYWSHPAWGIAAVALVITIYLVAGLKVPWSRSRILLPALLAVTAYGVVGGLAEAALAEGDAPSDAAFLATAARAVSVSFTLGGNGLFVWGVSIVAFWTIDRCAGRHQPPSGAGDDRGGGDGLHRGGSKEILAG